MSDLMHLHLERLTPKEIREGSFDTAVLPVGATEYHGDHLPYSTDTIMATALAERFAAELGTALVLPPIAYGMSLHLMAWPWTMSVRPETLTAIVIDVAESLLAHGITRLLVVPAHDGNPGPIETAARELNDRHGMTVAYFSGWQEMARKLLAGRYDVDLDHGGSSEMSIVLHHAPELAHHERAVDVSNQFFNHPIRVLGPFSNVVPHGYSGQPSRGSADEGAAILDAIAEAVGPFLRDLASHGWTNGSWMSGIEKGDDSPS
jgi:creatinine amidohydrolase